MASNPTGDEPFWDLVPAIPISVQIVLTAIFTTSYAVIFIACYVQLWLLLCLGYSRRWHPFGLLWLALIWAGLRILLFSFYWPFFGAYHEENISLDSISNSDAVLSHVLAYFLYAFPTCIQFCLLSLVASFALGISSREFNEPVKTVSHIRALLGAGCIIFLIASCVAAIIQGTFYSSSPIPLWLTATRVLIQDVLFLFVSIFLVILLRKVAALPHVSLILESLNTGRCGLFFTGSFLIVTFASRAIYDIVALALRSIPSFNYGWIDMSDHAEIFHLYGPNAAYAIFAVVLLVWDFLPTAVVLFMFRLRRPQLIRAPGPLASPFWGVDNVDDTLPEEWGFRVNESADENEELLASSFSETERVSPTPIPSSFGDSHRPVKFGVGSVLDH